MAFLVPQDRRGIRIFSEGVVAALGENFHHPMVEIIDGMILNRSEAAVIFLTGLIEITSQPLTEIFVLATQFNFFGPQQLYVLHGDFRVPAGATMQVSQVVRQRRKIEGRRFGGSHFLHRGLFDGSFRERFLFLSPFLIDLGRRVNGCLGRLVLWCFDFGFGCGYSFVRGLDFHFRFGLGSGDGRVVFFGSAIAWIQGNGNEIRENGKSGSKSGCGRLRTQHRRKRVARAARRASCHEVGVGLVQFVRGPLERSEIVAQRPRNSLFEGLLERFRTICQGTSLPFAIMETVLGGVNWLSRKAFLGRAVD
jgi:hypothetical protein